MLIFFKNILNKKLRFLYVDLIYFEKDQNNNICLYGNKYKGTYRYAVIALKINILLFEIELLKGILNVNI